MGNRVIAISGASGGRNNPSRAKVEKAKKEFIKQFCIGPDQIIVGTTKVKNKYCILVRAKEEALKNIPDVFKGIQVVKKESTGQIRKQS